MRYSEKRCRSKRLFEDRDGNTLSLQQLRARWQKSESKEPFEKWLDGELWERGTYFEVTPRTHISHNASNLPKLKREKRTILMRDFKLELTDSELAEIENCTSEFALDAVCKSLLINCYEQNRFTEKSKCRNN